MLEGELQSVYHLQFHILLAVLEDALSLVKQVPMHILYVKHVMYVDTHALQHVILKSMITWNARMRKLITEAVLRSSSVHFASYA